MKNGLKSETKGTFLERLNKVLLAYRRSPNVVTGKSPAELLFGRPFRSKLSLVVPGRSVVVPEESPHVHRSFEVGQNVYFGVYSGLKNSAIGSVEKRSGNVIYLARSGNIRYKRYGNQLRLCSSIVSDSDADFVPIIDSSSTNESREQTNGEPVVPIISVVQEPIVPIQPIPPAEASLALVRSSTRNRKPRVPFSP